jgi:hypothetical protein
MTYITQLTGRKTMSIPQIMTMMLAGFVLVVLQSSTVQAQWTTNGTNINNTNTGNVGIGTTTPGSKLVVQGPVSTDGSAKYSVQVIDTAAQGTGVGGGVVFTGKYDGAGNLANFGSVQGIKENSTNGNYAGALIFATRANGVAPAERLRIDSSGNVGIGNTVPTEFVHVRKDQNAATHLLVENATAGASAYADLQVKNNLGNFAQFGLYSSTTTTAGALASGNAFAYTTSPAMVIMANNAAGVIKFATGGLSERMRIDASGNFGIGTTTPSSKLHVVSGTDNSTSLLRLDTGVHGGTSMVVYGTTNNESGFDMSVYRAGLYFSRFGVNNTGNVYLQPGGGSVGIGTSTPNSSYAFDVNGNANVTGNLNTSGTITGGNIVAKYQDVAEWVQSSQELRAGTVVVLDQTKSNQVIASSQAYDTRVAGVISSQPGITLGENGAGKVLVATTGRVRIKVDASRGSIQIGDLLVTSDLAGVAMKSQPIDVGGAQIHRPGTLIGKALEPLEKGVGEILVLLSLQ